MTVNAASTSTFETLYNRVVYEGGIYYHRVMHWLTQRSDGEKLVIACIFILLLLLLIVRMSMRKESAGAGRNFGGSVMMVMIFAFGLGWMLDSGGGSLSFVFNA